MQTGTINFINWTFNFSQQYLGKVLVQYIHPSDIASVVISLMMAARGRVSGVGLAVES